MTPQLLVDVGNSRCKWWWQQGHSLLASGHCLSSPEALAADLASASVAAPVAALASVGDPAADPEYARAIEGATGAVVHVCRTSGYCLGLRNSYENPESMGVDRWLAMLAAWQPHQQPVCVVDAGTALTIDLVAASGQHEGGYILPGTRLMQESLTARAQRIAVTPITQATLRPGRSTQACVGEGAWLAAVGALREVMRRYPDHHVVVSGGDGQQLLQQGLNGEWRPDLVRDGLALWLRAQQG
jgi:type III pantothenate kinase